MRAVVRELRRATRRQLAALLTVAVLALAIVVAGASGRQGWAVALLGLLGMGLFAAVLQLRRRLGAATEPELAGLRVTPTGGAGRFERLEAAHRRVLAAVETERLAAADRHRELLARIDRGSKAVAMGHRKQLQDVEALLQLYRDFRPRAPMPPSAGWALDPADLLEVLQLVERHRPKLVLELGSGTSTVWLGYALERYGSQLVSVDHAPRFATRTRSMLALHSLERTAEVRLAPLRPSRIDGRDFHWYAEEAFADLSDVDLLLVDGPPGSTGQDARYPALPVLARLLAAGATIILDDAQRRDEQEIVQQWLATYPGLSNQPALFDRQAVLRYAPRPEARTQPLLPAGTHPHEDGSP